MKKMILLLTMVMAFSLTGCAKQTETEKLYETSENTADSFGKLEVKTSVVFENNDTPTNLDSYYYIDNENNRLCYATDENDPSVLNEYSTACYAINAMYDKEISGFTPFPTEDGVYMVHPIRGIESIQDMVYSYFDDDDVVESDDDNLIVYSKELKYVDFSDDMRMLISQGYQLSMHEIPVRIVMTYDKELEMFTSFRIDNLEVMKQIYTENFGTGLNLTKYYIDVEISEYTEDLSFFIPDEVVYDDHVNYFGDGDYFGYYRLTLGKTIKGKLEYANDQDIIEILVPEGGIYNLSYINNNYDKSILFALYDKDNAPVGEGVIGRDGDELSDFYLSAGVFYVVLFSHNNASGYELEFTKIS